MHCLIVASADGMMLRDLAGGVGTQVNGKRTEGCALHEGDQINIGPFQFKLELEKSTIVRQRVRLAEDSTGDDPNWRAARIQVAAVAAQQASLHELEFQLSQRQTTLDQQQHQLASHLEEKRQRLVELYTQTQQSRKALKEERESYQQRVEEVNHDLSQAQLELLDEKKAVVEERDRLAKLNRRLKQRFELHWSKEREEVEAKDAMLAEAWHHVQGLQKRVHQNKVDLAQICLRFNTDVEIGRRRLEQEWSRVQLEKEEFRKRAEKWGNALMKREDELVEAEERLGKEQSHWQIVLERSRHEAAGLEKRTCAQRRVLAEQQSKIGGLDAKIQGLERRRLHLQAELAGSRVWPIALPIPAEHRIEHWLKGMPKRRAVSPKPSAIKNVPARYVGDLEQIVGEVEDQWRCLSEQWHSLLTIRAQWNEEHREIRRFLINGLERFREKALRVAEKEVAVSQGLAEIHDRHQQITEQRQSLVGWQGKLETREVNCRAAEERANARIRSREDAVEKQLQMLDELGRRWNERRRQELEAVKGDRQACERTRKELETLISKRREELARLREDQQQLTAEALAVEQHRRRYLKHTRNADTAERKIERLTRRLARDKDQNAEVVREEIHELQTQIAELQLLHKQAVGQIETHEAQKAALVDEQRESEKIRVQAENGQLELQHQLNAAQSQCRTYQEQILELQGEMDRMARMLMDEPPPPAVLLRQQTSEPQPQQKKAA